MKYRKTEGEYSIHVRIENHGDQTKAIFRLEKKNSLMLMHQQTYELTRLDLILEEESKLVLKQIAQDMETI